MFEKNVLITGGAGFIGSHLAEEVLKKGGSKIYILDNLSSKTYAKQHPIEKIDFEYGRVEEIANTKYYTSTIPKLDYILHLASPASPMDFMTRPLDIITANTMGTRNMLELARKNDSVFLFASSSEIYGQVPRSEIPIKESYNGNINPIGPRACYDESKRMGEAITYLYHKMHGLDVKIARIFNTYGPRMPDDGRVMSSLIYQAVNGKPLTVQGDGMQTRTFLYIEDLIDGLIKLMKSKVNEPINLGSINEITIKALAEKILSMKLGTMIYTDRNEGDPDYRKPDISKAKNLLEWEPTTSLDDGLEKTFDYYYIIKAAQMFR